MASTVDASLCLWQHLHGTFGVRSLSKIPAKDSRQMKVTRMEREERNGEQTEGIVRRRSEEL